MTSWSKVGVLLGALVLGALCVEGFVRLTWDPTLEPSTADTVDLTPMLRYSADPGLYYELRPGLDMPFGGGRVLTDSHGYRIREAGAARSEGLARQGDAVRDVPAAARPLRLAVVGASSTFGYGVPVEHIYPELLRAGLAERAGRPAELLNASVPAYNTRQQARLFERDVLPWRPDVVIWHYDHRDAFPALRAGAPVRLDPSYGDNLLGSQVIKLLRRRMRAREIARLRDDGGAMETCETYPAGGPSYDVHLAALDGVGRAAREAGVPVLVVIFDAYVRRLPTGPDHYPRLHAPLVERLQAAGLGVLDLYDPYQQLMTERGWSDLRAFWRSREPLDGHPNAEAHAWLAARIAPVLADWLAEAL